MSAQHQRQIVDYFRRGQVLFLVDGQWEPAADEQQLLAWARPIVAAQDPNLELSISDHLFFPSAEELLGGDIEGTLGGSQGPQQPEGAPLPPATGITGSSLEKSGAKEPYSSPIIGENGVFALVSADIPQLANIPQPGDPDKDQKLLQDASKLLTIIRALDEARTGVFDGRRLQVVSPNWLTSSGPKPGGTGGPGSRPTSYEGPTDTHDYKIQPDDTDTWLKGILSIPDDQRGAGVVVAILDTAPTIEATSPTFGENWVIRRADETDSFLGDIYKKWVSERGNPPLDPPDQHPLVRGLLDPANPRLTVYLNPNVDRADPNIEPDGYLQTFQHDYKMTDHGLFVAGLIHSLAPQAQLHLYQVLNRYGVGDLESIANALLDVYTRFAGERLVVNMSLTINMPRDEDEQDEDDEMGKSLRDYRKQEQKDVNSWSARQKQLAERICDLAYQIGSRIIAAAGNNRKGPQHNRPQARYPAALQSVLGVGALQKKNNPPTNSAEKFRTASYSNRADRPEISGITTLGGEGGKTKGVLGIYVGEFPRRQDGNKVPGEMKGPSQNGWAWWAGTSFAAPIISGLTAAVLAGPPSEPTTEAAIKKLFQGQLFETEDGEDVLFVTQGPYAQ